MASIDGGAIRPAVGDTKLWSRLRRQATELLAVTGLRGLEATHALCERFLLADVDSLRAEMATRLGERLLSGDFGDLKVAADMLFGDSKGRFSVQLAFDVIDPSTTRVYSVETRRQIESILPLDNGKQSQAEGVSAYGASTDLWVRPFPKVWLPVLNTYLPLVSMFHEAACNYRYGLVDSAIVPVSQEAALRMQDALDYIVAPERRGKTWRGIANSREKQDLLIVYVDGMPDISADVASLFGADLADAQFEVDASAVCAALDAIVRSAPRSKLNLFVIRQASEGQASVVLAEALTVGSVLAGARWWKEAAENIPQIRIPVRDATTRTTVFRSPPAPYPDQVLRLLSWDWVTNGERRLPVPGPSLADVLSLMLDQEIRHERALRLLDLAVERNASLLIGIGGALNDHQRFDRRARIEALRAVSTLGILLAATGHMKEAYMETPAFLVGKYLSLADALHRAYCLAVRGGALPPQLAGNALVPVARNNLADGLDRLHERLNPYIAWAETSRADGESQRDVVLGKWALGQMRAVSTKLAGQPIPTTLSQQDRAQLLLGYLARDKEEAEGE
ncbi:MAG: hypothetical protein M0R73_05150 [Dehalococcoidia bacterium]|nr:hypothetical protein [Dehalococcoidia bacterium]